jgi:hypothetical protein
MGLKSSLTIPGTSLYLHLLFLTIYFLINMPFFNLDWLLIFFSGGSGV